MNKVHPNTELAVNTPVTVGNQRGYVVKCERVPATPCGMISVHTIRFTERLKRLIGYNTKWVKIKKQKNEKVNYSFIKY